MVLGIACLLLPGEGSVNLFIYSCLLNDKFVIPCLFHVIRKISMVGCRITFGLRPHVIRHPTIDIFPYYVNKRGITNIIIADRVMRTRKQSGLRQILEVCKECACAQWIRVCKTLSQIIEVLIELIYLAFILLLCYMFLSKSSTGGVKFKWSCPLVIKKRKLEVNLAMLTVCVQYWG